MCPAVEIFSFSTLLCFTLGPCLHVTYLIYRTAKRKADFVRPQPPSRDYWRFPWRVMGPILGDPGAVSGLGERAGRKFSSTGERAPGYRLSSNYFQKFKRMPGPDWAQKMFCIILPNWQTVSPGFFSWVRTRRLLSCHTCLACKGNFYFLLS